MQHIRAECKKLSNTRSCFQDCHRSRQAVAIDCSIHAKHAVPVSPDRPKTVTAPTQWMLKTEEKSLDPPKPPAE